MIVVGLTGGIASGKSTVSAMFEEFGAHVIDYDLLAREVVRPNLAAWKEIVEYFGRQVLNEDSSINREKLGTMVFGDAQSLAKLNGIVHPEVFAEAERRVDSIAETDPNAIIIKDMPLLIETAAHKDVDKVVVVTATKENRLARLIDRGLTEDEARKRLASQLPMREKVKYADYVIYNDGTIEDTRKQVMEISRELRELASERADRSENCRMED